jgi:hypothetical protein
MYVDVSISEEHTAFMFIPENGDGIFLQDIGTKLQVPVTTQKITLII